MTQSSTMQLSRRSIIIIAIVIVSLIVLTIVMAPSTGSLQQRGSTYGRSPDGYGAWYTYMNKQGNPLKRWQKPFEALIYPNGSAAKRYQTPTQKSIQPDLPITLLRIENQIDVGDQEREWVKQGNVLLLLGIKTPATKAAFTSDLPSPLGQIRIETSRRQTLSKNDKPKETQGRFGEPIILYPQVDRLSDRFGSVVWQEAIGKGKIIYATTPYLAANAYQDFLGNYEFLAKLVTEPGHPLWVDEYMHGYKDPIPNAKKANKGEATEEDLLDYLSKTPLALLAIQSLVLLGVLLWGHRRLLPATSIEPAAIDNSNAYIQAMADVLHKANSTDFLVDTITKAEQRALQRALGLGPDPIPIDDLATVYTQQTNQPSTILKTILQSSPHPRQMNQADLQKWIDNIQTIRKTLPES
jgi:Domain of unknown function (DUF4350)